MTKVGAVCGGVTHGLVGCRPSTAPPQKQGQRCQTLLAAARAMRLSGTQLTPSTVIHLTLYDTMYSWMESPRRLLDYTRDKGEIFCSGSFGTSIFIPLGRRCPRSIVPALRTGTTEIEQDISSWHEQCSRVRRKTERYRVSYLESLFIASLFLLETIRIRLDRLNSQGLSTSHPVFVSLGVFCFFDR